MNNYICDNCGQWSDAEQKLERVTAERDKWQAAANRRFNRWQQAEDHVAQLRQENEKLEAEVKQLRHVRDWTPTRILELIDHENDYKARVAAEDHVAQLATALRQYGQHAPGCQKWWDGGYGQNTYPDPREDQPCTCGFEAALNEYRA